MKVACVGYRDWAIKIYDKLALITEHDLLIFRTKDSYDENIIYKFNPDYILFYGWSWIVKSNLLKEFKCIMLHPSPLPKYRGGSPIQNQIINGEKLSKVTIFHMNEGMDTGDILFQKEFSLEGSLASILDRIIDVGVELTLSLFNKGFHPIPQDQSKATYYKRRKPEDSELTINELLTKPAEYIYNKIRMLEDPYPNAFIRTIDNKKILLKNVEIE